MRKMKLKNKGTLLAILGSLGVVATTALAIKNTKDACEVLQDIPQELTTKAKLKIVLPMYVPTIISGTTTIACILSGNAVHVKNTEQLMMTCTALQNHYHAYRNSLIELYGEEANDAVLENMKLAHGSEAYHIIGLDTPDQKVIWDFYGDRFEAYEREIIDAEMHINRNYVLGSCITVNDVRRMFGLKEKPGQDDIEGWCINDDGLFWWDTYHVENQDEDGTVYYEIVPLFGEFDLTEWM